VRRVIRLRLAGEFRYPVLARRRGWEGEVVLAFRVDAEGRIGNVRIANSSGFGLLDSAARDALLRVATVALADGRRPGAALDLTLPVIYRLSEG
jgi:protein TonB